MRVCVLDIWMLCFFLLRDVFESLKYWLDLWLSSLFVAFISICFSSLWKTAFYQARQLLDRSSTAFYLSSLLNFFYQQKITQIRSIEISGVLLNRISTASSIHRETFYLADRSSIDSRSIEVGFYSIAARQLLDLSGPSCMHCFFFSHVLHLSGPSCFITFMHLFGFLVPLDHLYVSQVKLYSFLYPLSIMTKRGRKCDFFLRFYILGGEIHAFVRGICVLSC